MDCGRVLRTYLGRLFIEEHGVHLGKVGCRCYLGLHILWRSVQDRLPERYE